MAKKAQLTMFIIVGVFLAILIGVLIYSGTTKRQAEKEERIRESVEFPSELQPVGVFVQGCLEQEAEKTINVTALQGGRPMAPRHPYVWENMTLSHGYYMGLNELPTLEEMQNEMAGHLKLKLNDCIASLKDFKAKGMDLEYGNFEPKFIVAPDNVIVDLNFPITLKKETGEVKIEKFSAEIPSRLGYLHDAAYKIVEEDVRTDGKVTIYYITKFGLWLHLYELDEFLFVFDINREKVTDDRIINSFHFVNDYKENHDPYIEYISNIIASVGEEISFYANATDSDGDQITYSDSSKLFDIDPKTGLVQFTPVAADSEIVHINATDGKGGINTETFQIDVY